jgi:copper transport protein
VLATPPDKVQLLFDDAIRPAGGDRAVDAAGRSVLAGRAHRPGGVTRALVIPLRSKLPRGAYTVRWRVISDDGHLITGVLAFAVGAGSPRPVPTLSAGAAGPSAGEVLMRLLFLAGVLLAGGTALAARVLFGAVRTRLEAALVGGGLLLVAAGGFGLLALQPAANATRFGHATEVAAIAALVGAGSTLASFRARLLWPVSSGIGVAMLAAPTVAGHALDPGRGGALTGFADAVHVTGAGLWIGGLLLLALSPAEERARLGRRVRPLAIVGVALLVAAAIPRALKAFPAFADLFDTGYGRDVLVKTGLLVVVLGAAWLNRRRIRAAGVWAELTLIAGVVVAVAILTDLRPPVARTARALAVQGPPPAPPPDAVVLAQEDDDLAVGLAASPSGRDLAIRVSVLGQDGRGVSGLRVSVAGADATACGAGCYAASTALPAPPRRVPVTVGSRRLVFTLPERWPAPPAAQVVARAARVYRALRTLVIHERLASSAEHFLVTTYRVQAPSRLAYKIAGGPEAVIIGGTRWDRNPPPNRWERSEQEPLREPEPFWGTDPVRNARFLGSGRVEGKPVLNASFYDPRLPAWFELSVDPRTYRLLALRMTAQAHFMRHSYGDFNAPFRISPPR